MPTEKFGEGHGEEDRRPGLLRHGFVLVKKVPGHLWVTATSDAHLFHAESMNMSHVVHHFYFGQQLNPRGGSTWKSHSPTRFLERFHAGEKSGTGTA